MAGTRGRDVLSPDMASLRGLNGFEVTSTEIVLDRVRRRPAELRIFLQQADKGGGVFTVW